MAVSLLVSLAALCAVVNSVPSPTYIQLTGSNLSGKDMLAAMTQMAGALMTQNQKVPASQEEPAGGVEMQFSGFNAVIKSPGKPDSSESTHTEESFTEAPASELEGYMRHGDSVYKYHTDGADWETAQATCKREGAYLAIPNSDEEAQFLVSLFTSQRRHAYHRNEIWIGASDIANEGHFVTVLGYDLWSGGFYRWSPYQPDDWKLEDPSGEDCVALTDEASLNDAHCSANIAFICESDPTDDMLDMSTPMRSKPFPDYRDGGNNLVTLG